jgi:hypothetical protein
MTAVFPTNTISPRVKENRTGVDYDETKTKILFAEEITSLDDEVVAVEDALRGANGKMIPYGVKIGGPDSNVQIVEWVLDTLKAAMLQGTVAGSPVPFGLVINNTLVLLADEDGNAGIHVFNTDLENGCDINFILPGHLMQVKASVMFQRDDADGFFSVSGKGPVSGDRMSFQLSTDADNGRAKFSGNLYLLNWLDVQGYIKGRTTVEATTGFKNNGATGVTMTYDVVADTRFDSSQFGIPLQQRKRTITVSGGIITAAGDLSPWENVPTV